MSGAGEIVLLIRSLLEMGLKLQGVLGKALAEGRDVTPEEIAAARADTVNVARQRLVDSQPL